MGCSKSKSNDVKEPVTVQKDPKLHHISSYKGNQEQFGPMPLPGSHHTNGPASKENSIRQAQNQQESKENEEIPDILLGSSQPQQPRNREQLDIQSLPEFFTVNCSQIGKWKFYVDNCENNFDQISAEKIERDFLLGNSYSSFEMNGKKAYVSFSDNMLSIQSDSSLAQGSKSFYQVSRESIMEVKYWWVADDNTLRPIIKEIEEILADTGGIFSFKLDDIAFQVNLKKQLISEISSGVSRKIKY